MTIQIAQQSKANLRLKTLKLKVTTLCQRVMNRDLDGLDIEILNAQSNHSPPAPQADELILDHESNLQAVFHSYGSSRLV